jgi:aryl-alcohol dehydrogenase
MKIRAAVVEEQGAPFAIDELELELGATAIVDAGAEDPVEAVVEATGGGPAFSLEGRATPRCRGPARRRRPQTPVCARQRTAARRAAGEPVASFWQDGRFPVERMMTNYDFDQIDQAAHDAESGAVIKPVLRMSERSK